jgi:hypothetical protein
MNGLSGLLALSELNLRRPIMLVRPIGLSDVFATQHSPERFTLPIEAARNKAREIINQSTSNRLVPVVENWCQLPDGQIQFTVRCLPEAD